MEEKFVLIQLFKHQKIKSDEFFLHFEIILREYAHRTLRTTDLDPPVFTAIPLAE